MQPKINLYQTRGIGENINASIEFIKQNFKPLLKSVLFIAGPAIFLISIGFGIWQTTFLSMTSKIKQDPSAMAEMTSGILKYTYSGFFLFLIAFVFLITVVYQYIKIYSEKKEVQTISVKEIWSRVSKDWWIVVKTIIGLILVWFVIVLITVLVMFLVAGLGGVSAILASSIGGTTGTIMSTIIAIAAMAFIAIFMISILSPLALIFNVRINERKKFFNSISRCYNLASGYRWKIFGLIVVCIIIQFSVSFLFQLPVMLISTWHLISIDIADFSVLFTVFNTIALLLSFVLQIFFMININFLYFSIVESKESVGMMQKIDSLGSSPKMESVDEENY